ncbi:Rho GTPase-activating protein 12 [Heterocephalus glaber]|uniref:Rho GTPase-activating protein 12 n=1 Tax=Heterocephalus glaber TaxID=10181 RepID=G5BHE0_HETGA|nr:Rho GTPase-activating protein 12 [Heterocephalus glaber]
MKMADRSGKAVPGQVYTEVEYDYEYKAKDRKVVIKQGEWYILVKKTNEDWWKVKSDENSKVFYVLAQYVKKFTCRALMPPVKQATRLPNNSMETIQSLHLQRYTENVNKLPELLSFGKPSPSVQGTGLIHYANQNFGHCYYPCQILTLSLDVTHNNGKFNNDSHSPKVSSQNRTHLFGHFADQVFGANLVNWCQRENSTVPEFVRLCIAHVEEQGLDGDGFYGVSGNLTVIQKLRFVVNHDEKLDLNDSK